MTANGWFQILLYLALILLITKPIGIFMTRVFNRERTFMDPVLRPIERLLYRLTGVDENHEIGRIDADMIYRPAQRIALADLCKIIAGNDFGAGR